MIPETQLGYLVLLDLRQIRRFRGGRKWFTVIDLGIHPGVDRHFDKLGVTGSSPVSPTTGLERRKVFRGRTLRQTHPTRMVRARSHSQGSKMADCVYDCVSQLRPVALGALSLAVLKSRRTIPLPNSPGHQSRGDRPNPRRCHLLTRYGVTMARYTGLYAMGPRPANSRERYSARA